MADKKPATGKMKKNIKPEKKTKQNKKEQISENKNQNRGQNKNQRNKNNKALQSRQNNKPQGIKNRGRKNGSKQKQKVNEKVKIAFLGGINEVGKNITLYEYGDDMFIVDCGLAFPDQDMPGVDLVIPDFSYLEKNVERIRGVVITHGHEDHIGALAYLLKTVNVPVFGTRLTIGLIEGKLKEHKMLGNVILKTVEPGDRITLGKFNVEFIHVNHSIPDAVALAIKSPAGVIVQTGDFKFDCTPIDGGMIDIARFAQLGNEGVLALLSDSTNAERPGFTVSERKVGESFGHLFRKAGQRRIIVATFASNIHRVQQIIDVAQSLGRKVALSGRSLENVVAIGAELGYLKVPENILVSIDMLSKYTSAYLPCTALRSS